MDMIVDAFYMIADALDLIAEHLPKMFMITLIAAPPLGVFAAYL